MSSSANKRPTGSPSVLSVFASQALSLPVSILRPSPGGNFLRSSSGTALCTGKRRGSDDARIVSLRSSTIVKRGSKPG